MFDSHFSCTNRRVAHFYDKLDINVTIFCMKNHQNARDLSILIRLTDVILNSLQITENTTNLSPYVNT